MALLTWSLRRQHKLENRLNAIRTTPSKLSAGASPKEVPDQRLTQRAVALLYQALLTDTHLTYVATTESWANYGGKKIRSQARITRAPQKLAIAYLNGDRRGLHTGFSERWSWRQESGAAPMQPFAAIGRDTSEMVTRRFAMLLENYGAHCKGKGRIDGRPVEIVELWPFHPVQGARGPGKKLWIDSETDLILRVETYNHQRQTVMMSELRNVKYNPRIAPDTFKAPQKILASAQKESWMAQDMGHDIKAVARRVGIYPPRLAQADLPPGFHLEAVGMHRCEVAAAQGREKEGYSALSRYTDGLNTLTLFAMKEPVAKSSAKSDAKEQTCEFGPGAVIVRDSAKGRLMAVGDLPSAVLGRLLEKVHVELYKVP